MTLHRIESGHYFINAGDWQYRIQHVRQVREPHSDLIAQGDGRRPWVVRRSATAPRDAFRGAFATLREARAAAIESSRREETA